MPPAPPLIADSPCLRLRLPHSKSVAGRVIACAALYGSPLPAVEPDTDGDDAGRVAAAFHKLTACDTAEIAIGSGAAPLRFLLAAAASLPGKDISITCSDQLAARPHAPLVEALLRLGADIAMPAAGVFHVNGRRLEGGMLSIDASLSSQYISALMMAAPLWRRGLTLRLEGRPVSAPYIDMTARVMRSYGIAVSRNDDIIDVSPIAARRPHSPAADSSAAHEPEADWSAASYIYEAVALYGTRLPAVSLPGLLPPGLSLQGDARCAEIFAPFVSTRFTPDGAILTAAPAAARPASISIDMAHVPDLVPAFAATLCALRIPFSISGIEHLRHKESDRIEALGDVLGRLGYPVEARAPGASAQLTYSHSGAQTAARPATIEVPAHGDHRIAMSAAMLAPALAPCKIKIDHPQVVDKSFPGFFDVCRELFKSANYYEMRSK